MERLQKWFNEFNNTFLSPHSIVADFILSSQTNIVEVWNQTLLEYNKINSKSVKFNLVDKTESESIILDIHPFVMEQIFMHIVGNREKYAPSAKCSFTLYKEVRKSQESIILQFQQDTPFVREVNGNRGLSSIRYMLNVYGGTYYHLDDTRYTFEIALPLNVINNA